MSCAGSSAYQPNKKYAPQDLQRDFDMVWETYQQVHPSYDWFAPRDSVNQRFANVRATLTDSLTEPQFRLRLSYAVSGINCGHTSVRSSKAYTRYIRDYRGTMFPLDLQVLPGDSLVVVNNKLRDSGMLKRGDVVLSINTVPAAKFISQMRQYISSDGYNTTFKDDIISRGFASRFQWLYGLQSQYKISYLDSTGAVQHATLKNFTPKKDTAAGQKPTTRPAAPATARQQKPKDWLLVYDSTKTIAFIQLKSFSGVGLRRFFKRSFKDIKKQKVEQLIIDVSENGGGEISNYVALSRYMVEEPFRIADSVSAVSFKFPYKKQVQAWAFYNLFGWMIASRQSDGRLHMRVNEGTVYKPRKKHHYNGNLYVLTGGFSFSATTLFLNSMRNRHHFVQIGEETGGGIRGNSAVMVPNLRLPNTGVSVRLPLFRLVTDHTLPHNGRGGFPQVYAPATSHSVRYRYSPAISAARRLIKESSNTTTNQ